MPFTALLSDAIDDDGFIETERLTSELHITKREVAAIAGLSHDAVTKIARLRVPAMQSRLREGTEILTRVQGWAGSRQHALV